MSQTTYSDESLRSDLLCSLPGLRRKAELLLQIPQEARGLVMSDAHRAMNAMSLRPSDAISYAVQAWKAGVL